MERSTTEVTAGLIGTAVLAGSFFALNLPIVAAAGVAVAVYAGTRLLLTKQGAGDDLTDEHFLRASDEATSELERIARTVTKESVRVRLASITSSARRILAILGEDPAKIPLARGFVDYTLRRSTGIVSKYQQLSAHGAVSTHETLAKAESLLELIDRSFREQIDRLLLHDAADLGSEIDVLETRLKFEEENNQP